MYMYMYTYTHTHTHTMCHVICHMCLFTFDGLPPSRRRVLEIEIAQASLDPTIVSYSIA